MNSVPSADTFPRLLAHHASTRPRATAIREKDLGIWQSWTWQQMHQEVSEIAAGLLQAGFKRGQHLAIIGENRPRLYFTMTAVQCLGGIPVPMYQDAAAAEMVFVFDNAEIHFAVVEDQEQVDKVLEIREKVPHLQHIFYDDARGLRNYQQPGLQSYEALRASGRQLLQQQPDGHRRRDKKRPRDRCRRDVLHLGHDRKRQGCRAWIRQPDRSRACGRRDGGAESGRTSSRVSADGMDRPEYFFVHAVAGMRLHRELPRVSGDCHRGHARDRPHLLLRPAARARGVADAGDDPYGRRFCDQAAHVSLFHARSAQRRRKVVGQRAGRASADRVLYSLGDLFVYAPLRNSLGMSRVRVAYTAGEAIGPDLFTFYRSLGINLKQLYGSTETSVFVCVQENGGVKADTVGPPVKGVEIKLTDAGEILIRSPGLFREYYKAPEATHEAKDAEGWFHTGDAGYFDQGGHLKIIDRAKDVGKLADGTLFAPKYIENKLKFFPTIKEAVAFGDQRQMVTAFLNIDMEAVGNWAERHNLPYAGYTDLAAKPEVLALLREAVGKVNADLANDPALANAQIHRFIVLHKELDADDDELTRTRKVRRRFIGQKFDQLVDAMYGGLNEQYVETAVKFEDGRSGKISATLKVIDAEVFSALKKAA